MNTEKEALKRVKIVSSVGPAISSETMIEKAIKAGVNVFRLNFSHGAHEDHKKSYDIIRAVAKKLNMPVGILADLQGPKLRVGKFKDSKVVLSEGETFILDQKDELGDKTRVNLPHPQIFAAIKEDDILLIDDGKIRLQVEKFDPEYIETKVINGGEVSNFKGVNFPSGILQLSALTTKDAKDLDFALSLGVDIVALSFVQLPSDIENLKNIIKGKAKVIAKIEKPSAIEYIEDIINVADGIMVARGDLGVEIPTEKVPVVQKQIIRECRKQSKPVIVATQMLDSMTFAPIPTRAEASDVANAVYDGADAVMLSGETTVGKYPIETIKTMVNIINQVESDPLYWNYLDASYDYIVTNYIKSHPTTGRAITSAAKQIADTLNSKVVVAFSTYGTTVNRISHQKLKARILSVTDNAALYNQMNLSWGVTPLLVDSITSFSEIIDVSTAWLKKNKWVEVGDKIVVVAGIPVAIGGITNSIRVVEID